MSMKNKHQRRYDQGRSPLDGEIQMNNGLNAVITQLERQMTAIDKALAALRDAEGFVAPAVEATPPTRKGGMTPEGRKRLVSALKRRWRLKKAAAEAVANRRSEGQKKRWAGKNEPARVATKKAPRKGAITEDGRQRLAEAMKRRWAIKRAASAVKKTHRKAA
jgi:hypothetical protein